MRISHIYSVVLQRNKISNKVDVVELSVSYRWVRKALFIPTAVVWFGQNNFDLVKKTLIGLHNGLDWTWASIFRPRRCLYSVSGL